MKGAPSRAPSSRLLIGAFPFEHRPAGVVVDGELGEDGAEVDVAVAGRPEAPGAVRPVGEAGIDALLRGRAKLRVLDVKGLDALVVDVDEADIVEVLQAEVRRVVVDAAALVPVDHGEEALVGRPVEQILAGVEFEAAVDAEFVVEVEDRPPASGEFVEGRVDEVGRARRPRIDERPGEGAGEGDVRVEAEIAAGAGGELHLVDAQAWRAFGVAAHLRRREGIERVVEDRIDRHQLALEVGGEFGDLDAVLRRDPLQFVAVGPALRRLLAGRSGERPRRRSAPPCSRATAPSRRSRRRC